MARKKRGFTTFNLSFLDIMSCGFGAVVLVFLIIDHSIEVEQREEREKWRKEMIGGKENKERRDGERK